MLQCSTACALPRSGLCPAQDPGHPKGTASHLPLLQLMCSVEDVPRAMREILRVLRPGGKYIFLEHVGAPHHTHLHSLQRWLTPVSAALADGCHVDRDTLGQIEAAGFSRVEADHFNAPVPWPASVFAPHIAGVATK
jgi:hypothetical protein